MRLKKILYIATVSTLLSGHILVSRVVRAQENEPNLFNNKVDKTTESQPLETGVYEQIAKNSLTNQIDQTTESINKEATSESISSSQEILKSDSEVSQRVDSKTTEETSSSDQTTSVESSTDTRRNFSEMKQTNEKAIETGWTYMIRGDYAYITSSDLMGDVEVPNTLGGKPIRFEKLDKSVFTNYQKITSLIIRAPFYTYAISFKDWTNLESVDLNLTSVGNNSTKSMFEGLSKLQKIDLNNFDTSGVTDMSYMFLDTVNLNSLNVSKFNTSSVKDMSFMFSGITRLTTLDVSKFDTSNVKDMSFMFSGAISLESLDVSKFNTSNVTNMNSMFNNCNRLTTLNVSSFNTSKVSNMTSMFSGCSKLTSLDVSNFDTSKVTNMKFMFYLVHLTSLNVSNWNTANVVDMNGMFYNCYNLSSLDVSNWDTSKVTNMTYMFFACTSLVSLDVSNFNTLKVTNMSYMFTSTGLKSLDVSKFKTSNVINMTSMFNSSNKLTSLNVSNWDTSNVISMDSMFSFTGLTSLNVSNWNTSKVTNMRSMFSNCKGLTSLDVPNWDTSNVTDISGMFLFSPNFTRLDASNWKLSNIMNMANIFMIPPTDPDQMLIIQAGDQKLLTYDYTADKRIPGGPKFNPNGGTFTDGTVTDKSYFSKVAMTNDEYKNKISLTSLREYLKNNEPIKEMSNLVNWTDSSGNSIEKVTNILNEINTTYTANWQVRIDPNIPDGSTPPSNVNPKSNLGIAYYPTELSIPKTELNDSGGQSISIQTTSIHIGVKDHSATTSWTLRAKLNWENKNLLGSSIRSDNDGKVYKNENNGSDAFTDNDLKTTTEVSGKSFPTISETEASIMNATSDRRTGVYDYSLGHPTLFIPETKYIEPNQYSGTIQWNLVLAP